LQPFSSGGWLGDDSGGEAVFVHFPFLSAFWAVYASDAKPGNTDDLDLPSRRPRTHRWMIDLRPWFPFVHLI
jgi:hypothetical protein